MAPTKPAAVEKFRAAVAAMNDAIATFGDIELAGAEAEKRRDALIAEESAHRDRAAAAKANADKEVERATLDITARTKVIQQTLGNFEAMKDSVAKELAALQQEYARVTRNHEAFVAEHKSFIERVTRKA